MELDFESIVLIAHQIRFEKMKKSLQDAEVMALHCAWFNLSYANFIKNQAVYQNKYWRLYRNPSDEKSVNTLPACSCKVMRMFEGYFSLSRLTKKSFRASIDNLYKNEDPKFISLLQNIQLEVKEEEKVNPFESNSLNLNLDPVQTQLPQLEIENINLDKLSENEIFVGRDNDIENIIKILKSKPIILLQGFHGVGKTTLLDYLGRELKDYKYYYTDFRYINSFEEWMTSLLSLSDFECGQSFTELIKQTFKFLETTKSLVIIDSISKLSDDFSGFLESYALNGRINSKIIISSSHPIKFSIPPTHYQQYRLKGLIQEEDIEIYFQKNGLVKEDKLLWRSLVEKYEGNFRELFYVSKFIKNFYGGKVSKYLGVGSNILSSDLKSFFDSIVFTEVDKNIFNICYQNKAILSEGLMLLLRQESSTSEIFSRISYLSEHGFLNFSERDDGMVIYSISPLLETYLIQEKLINA